MNERKAVMRTTMNKKLVFGLLALAFLAGCAKEAVKPRILWPPLPNRPRLEWIGTYYSQDDFPKAESEKISDTLLGRNDLDFFALPFGIASNGAGLVFVSDPSSSTVKVFDFNGRKVFSLSQEKIFFRPYGMALDAQGRLYVGDTGHQKIFVFSPDLKPVATIGGKELFTKPVFMAINDKLGRLYVSDGYENKIVVFDLEGKHLFSFGEKGNAPGSLFGPQGVAVDPQGRVFVADQFNARIQVFDADGKYLYNFGERGDQQWQFEFPKDLAFDSEGHLHIVDSRKSALITYEPDGKLLLFTGSGTGTNPLALSLPTAIHIDRNDRLYIVDQINRRFSVWQYLSDEFLKKNPIEGMSVK